MPRFLIRDGRVRSLTAAIDPAELPDGWRGILAVEDEITGDDRMFSANAIAWSDGQVLPLEWAKVRAGPMEGHANAVTVGTIDRVWRDGPQVWGEGRFDLDSEEGAEAARRVHEGLALAPSVDLDRVDVEIQVVSSLLGEGFAVGPDVVVVDEDGAPVEEEEEEEDDDDAPAETPDDEEREVVMRYRPGEELAIVRSADLRGATLVSIPAFASTTIEPVYGYTSEADPVAEAEQVLRDDAVVASVKAVRPPGTWFADPGFSKVTPLTIDGRQVYGHIAAWGTCHTGFPGECVEPPSSAANYAYFHTGALLTDSGELPVGRMTVDTTHAGRRLSATDTIAHYEHSGTCVAYVRAGEDAYGIWVAGMLKPSATEAQVDELRAHPPSGDWRRIGTALELVACLAVNSPGFPVPRAMVAGGHVTALQRPGIQPEDDTPRWDLDRGLLDRFARREAANQRARVDAVRLARVVDRVGR